MTRNRDECFELIESLGPCLENVVAGGAPSRLQDSIATADNTRLNPVLHNIFQDLLRLRDQASDLIAKHGQRAEKELMGYKPFGRTCRAAVRSIRQLHTELNESEQTHVSAALGNVRSNASGTDKVGNGSVEKRRITSRIAQTRYRIKKLRHELHQLFDDRPSTSNEESREAWQPLPTSLVKESFAISIGDNIVADTDFVARGNTRPPLPQTRIDLAPSLAAVLRERYLAGIGGAVPQVNTFTSYVNLFCGVLILGALLSVYCWYCKGHDR